MWVASTALKIHYLLPMQKHPKFLGMVPNPVNTSKIEFSEMEINDKVIILQKDPSGKTVIPNEAKFFGWSNENEGGYCSNQFCQ